MDLPSADAIERAGLRCWPGTEEARDGSWFRRAANGHTQRANSVQPLDPGDDGDLERRIARSRAWFAARGLPPIFRMTPLAPPALTAALDAAGWVSREPSLVLAMPMPTADPDPQVEVVPALDARFLESQRVLQGYADEKLGKLRALLGAVKVPAAGIVLCVDGVPVASSVWAVADGIAVTGNVITDAARRRQGHAAAMMRTGLAWAREAGATVASLNVVAGNGAALGLYRSLGYRQHYGYVYRYPGTP